MEYKILPYDESLLISKGCFIKPNGEVVKMSWTIHDVWAKQYCLGERYEYLLELRDGKPIIEEYEAWNKSIENDFKDYARETGYTGRREDLDVYASSSLLPEELALFKKWENSYFDLGYYRRNYYTDFMVYVLGWDVLFTIGKNYIATACYRPHVRFYNYVLLGSHIDHHYRMMFDERLNEFVHDDTCEQAEHYNANSEMEEEISRIHNEVPQTNGISSKNNISPNKTSRPSAAFFHGTIA